MSIITSLDNDLKGLPNQTLTWVLVGIGILAIIIAFVGNPTTKAVLAAWLIAP